MSKGKIPESMDLLLDTMCNTFGGIMFIAISLSLAAFVCRPSASPEQETQKLEQELQILKQETQVLENQKQAIEKKLASYKKYTANFQGKKEDARLALEVASLEHKSWILKQKLERQKQELKNIQEKRKNTERKNRTAEKDLVKKEKEEAEKADSLRKESEELSLTAERLAARKPKTIRKKIHFPHNQRTSKSPFILIIQGNKLFKVGPDGKKPYPGVKANQDGNVVYFTPIHGRTLSALDEKNIPLVLDEFKKNYNFLWIMVHPDSMEQFVTFRRQLRTAGYQVHWYICTEGTFYVTYTRDVSYSASN